MHSDVNVDRLQISQRGTYYVKMIIGNMIKLNCDVFGHSHAKTEVRHSIDDDGDDGEAAKSAYKKTPSILKYFSLVHRPKLHFTANAISFLVFLYRPFNHHHHHHHHRRHRYHHHHRPNSTNWEESSKSFRFQLN